MYLNTQCCSRKVAGQRLCLLRWFLYHGLAEYVLNMCSSQRTFWRRYNIYLLAMMSLLNASRCLRLMLYRASTSLQMRCNVKPFWSLYATETVSCFKRVKSNISWNRPPVISMSFVCLPKVASGSRLLCPGGSLTGYLESGGTRLSLAEYQHFAWCIPHDVLDRRINLLHISSHTNGSIGDQDQVYGLLLCFAHDGQSCSTRLQDTLMYFNRNAHGY